jgi:zinc transport system substrate-binding protein
MKTLKRLAMVSCCAVLLTGCQSSASDSKFKVAATFAPLYDITCQLVQNKMDVRCIIGDQEPHGFSLENAQDRAFMASSDLIVAYGHQFDSWAKGIKDSVYFEATSGVTFLSESGTEDPHAWLSMGNMTIMLNSLCDKVVALDPSNAAFYKKNRDTYAAKLESLGEEYQAAIGNGKRKRDYLVASHAAFGYLARDYGFTQIGIADFADNEPSAKRLSDVITLIKDNDVHVIVVEELDSVGFVETIKNELAKQNYSVTYDALDAYEGVDVKTYATADSFLDVMSKNLTLLKEILC